MWCGGGTGRAGVGSEGGLEALRGAGAAGLEGEAPDATRGGGSSGPSAAGEGGAVSNRRHGRFEKVRAGH
jgi:hypothetical protein